MPGLALTVRAGAEVEWRNRAVAAHAHRFDVARRTGAVAQQAAQLGDPLPTVTTHDRFGLVTIAGQDYVIADIGMRMLQPRELYRAQGFLESYAIDRGADGRVLSKAAQVRMCGNSVCPPLARALVMANYSERQALRQAA